jgi:parvulin-like peptidyl-prolyl isomerase
MARRAVGRATGLRSERACRGCPSPRMETKPIMKRAFVVTLLSLAAAGCAQSRSALSSPDARAPDPVAVQPVPSLHDTINSGMGNPAIVRTAIKDPDSPHWSGRAPANPAAPSPSGGAPGPVKQNALTARTAGAVSASGPIAATVPTSPPPEGALTQAPDGVTAADTPIDARGAVVGQGGNVAQGVVATPVSPIEAGMPLAADLSEKPAQASAPIAQPEPASGPVPSQSAASERETVAGLPTTGPIPVPPETPTGGPAPAARGPEIPTVTASAPDSSALATPEPIAPRQPPTQSADPLLGPNPGLMPPIPDLSELEAGTASKSKPSPKSAPAPKAARPSTVTPANGPEAAVKPRGPDVVPAKLDVKASAIPQLPDLPDPVAAPSQAVSPPGAVAAPAVIPLELESAPPSSAGSSPGAPEQPKAPGDSASLTEPARAGSVAALPALEPAPGPGSPGMAFAARAAPEQSSSPRSDPNVIVTSLAKTQSSTSIPAKAKDATDARRRVELEQPGRPVARVGEEIITYHDVIVPVREHRAFRELKTAYKMGSESDKREAAKHFEMLYEATLDNLINRSLLVQEAKHHMGKKDAKLLNMFNELADQTFRQAEIVPLQRQYQVDTEYQLKEKLAAQGRSITQMQQDFRQMFIADQYLHSKLASKIKVDLPDLLKYYDEHVKNHEFDRPALITWREIVVEPIEPKAAPNAPHDSTVLLTSDRSSHDVARREAEVLLEKLRKGDDFATLAKKESDGPTRSRNQGGLMETSPGGYGVPAVNQALESLPIGQLSGVIEGPDGFHIVKVEKRRPAGPLSFEEVQNQIKPILENAKFVTERNAFLAKLRKNTVITRYDLNPRTSQTTRAQN